MIVPETFSGSICTVTRVAVHDSWMTLICMYAKLSEHLQNGAFYVNDYQGTDSIQFIFAPSVGSRSKQSFVVKRILKGYEALICSVMFQNPSTNFRLR